VVVVRGNRCRKSFAPPPPLQAIQTSFFLLLFSGIAVPRSGVHTHTHSQMNADNSNDKPRHLIRGFLFDDFLSLMEREMQE
jgi:hypothetical protein